MIEISELRVHGTFFASPRRCWAAYAHILHVTSNNPSMFIFLKPNNTAGLQRSEEEGSEKKGPRWWGGGLYSCRLIETPAQRKQRRTTWRHTLLATCY